MILTVVAIILGTGLFFLVNSMLDITYFGCAAIGSLWFGCFIISYAILTFLGGFVLGLLKWILIGAVVLAIIGIVGSKIKGNEE